MAWNTLNPLVVIGNEQHELKNDSRPTVETSMPEDTSALAGAGSLRSSINDAVVDTSEIQPHIHTQGLEEAQDVEPYVSLAASVDDGFRQVYSLDSAGVLQMR